MIWGQPAARVPDDLHPETYDPDPQQPSRPRATLTREPRHKNTSQKIIKTQKVFVKSFFVFFKFDVSCIFPGGDVGIAN